MISWNNLPDSLIFKIICYLEVLEAYQVSKVSKGWFICFKNPGYWKQCTFVFTEEPEVRLQLRWVNEYSPSIRSVTIKIDQFVASNRSSAIKLLKTLENVTSLESLSIIFTGQNPLFYAGQEFMDPLISLCTVKVESLKKLDLGSMPIMLIDDILLPLCPSDSTNTSALQYLDIQNKQLVCKITPECILKIVHSCRQLQDLRAYHSSLSDLAIKELAGADRAKMKHISLMCRRQEKYTQAELSGESWDALTAKSPNLVVTMKFDHTCPIEIIYRILKPNIPIYNLYFETYTILNRELRLATNMYHETLRKLVIQSQPSEELDEALLYLARKCTKLSSIHVLCILDQGTIDTILQLHPTLKKTGDYTLKYNFEPHPWVSDDVLDKLCMLRCDNGAP